MQNADCNMQYSAIHTGCSLVATRYHSLANRHSCLTPAETHYYQCMMDQHRAWNTVLLLVIYFYTDDVMGMR